VGTDEAKQKEMNDLKELDGVRTLWQKTCPIGADDGHWSATRLGSSERAIVGSDKLQSKGK